MSLVYPSCIGGISRKNRFADDKFLERHSSGMDFLDGSSIEVGSCSLDEEFIICIVLCFDLIVELNHIEIDEISHFFVDSDVGSVCVILFFEVRCLGSVAENMIGNLFPDSFGELD